MPDSRASTLPTQCPACGASVDAPFFTLPGVPLQSNLLLTTPAEAAAMPTGDLALCFCPACGFITNAAFDPASQELSAKYEASQGFSPTFGKFARSLADTWSSRYGLAGRLAVEIGCGKGEFLALLCRTTGCRGVGFDPTLDPARLPDVQGLEIQFKAELFDERSAAAMDGFDFVCCRHTLEHIPDVRAFVSMVRRAIGQRDSVRVGFEVPDTLRVLTEGAFWDMYYEHCSYFTPVSLGGLFRRCGFDVLDIRREFDGQYLIVEAAPRDGTANAASAAGEVAEIADAVAAFAGTYRDALARWRGVVDDANRRGQKVVLWGASSKAVGFLSGLGFSHREIPAAVDINPHKQGTYLPTSGVPIVSPEALQTIRPEVVILMNPIYRDEIGRDLQRLGVSATMLAA